MAELCAAAGARDPVGMAKELCLVLEGTYVTRQVTQSDETMGIARRLAERVLEHHLGTASR